MTSNPNEIKEKSSGKEINLETGESTENPYAQYYVAADMTTSFIILIGVFFPSVTGGNRRAAVVSLIVSYLIYQ